MASGRDEQELRELLTAGVGARLAPTGWEILKIRDRTFTLAAFRLALEGPFAAIAELGTPARIIGPRLPLQLTGVSVGVSYEPLRDLAPLLDRFDHPLVTESIWPQAENSDTKTKSHERSMQISTREDAERAAEAVAAEISEHALLFAERHADLEGLVRRFSDSDDERQRLTPAALLTAAGRIDEAQARLEELVAVKPTERNRWIRRGAYQLRRWIAHNGDPSLIPGEFPPRRTDDDHRMSLSENWGEQQRMRTALSEFRTQAAGKTREQARVILRDTLIRHGRLEQGPIWIEGELDRLQTTSGDQLRSGLHTLALIGLGTAKALQSRKLPDFSAPDRFEPPDHALYETPHTSAQTAVIIDPDAREWLLDVYHQARRHLDIARFTVWLRHTTGPVEAPTELEVLLGDRRIGTISQESQPNYTGLLATAQARAESPCLDIHLTLHGDDLLVAIGKPT